MTADVMWTESVARDALRLARVATMRWDRFGVPTLIAACAVPIVIDDSPRLRKNLDGPNNS